MITRISLPETIMKNAGTAATAEARPPQKITLLAPKRAPRRPPVMSTGISTTAAIMLPSSIRSLE